MADAEPTPRLEISQGLATLLRVMYATILPLMAYSQNSFLTQHFGIDYDGVITLADLALAPLQTKWTTLGVIAGFVVTLAVLGSISAFARGVDRRAVVAALFAALLGIAFVLGSLLGSFDLGRRIDDIESGRGPVVIIATETGGTVEYRRVLETERYLVVYDPAVQAAVALRKDGVFAFRRIDSNDPEFDWVGSLWLRLSERLHSPTPAVGSQKEDSPSPQLPRSPEG